MKKESSLTKREKLLMIICVFVAVIVLTGKFVISPMLDKHNELLENYDVLAFEKGEIEITLLSEAVIRSDYENAQEIVEESKKRFPTYLSNEEIGRRLTELCGQNGIEPRGMNILSAVGAAVGADGNNSAEAVQNSPVLYTVSANMNLIGNLDSFKNLISAIEEIDYIRVARAAFSENRDGSRGDYSNMSVVIEVTMLRKGL